jgi:hypothetical protein
MLSLLGSIVLSLPGWAAEPTARAAVPAIILRIEGNGLAQVRKRSGIVETAGEKGKIYAGDKILTDARSAVHLMLADGSVIKVGVDSELAVNATEDYGTYFGWAFRLSKGAIRALVELVPAGAMHFRVDTPSGSLGVRGTDFVLAYQDATGATLYTLDGEIAFGAPNCAGAKTCVSVHGGETATATVKGTTKPAKFDVKELFAAGNPGFYPSRLALFEDVQKAAKAPPLEEPALGKLLANAKEEFADAQDRAIGRTKAERESLHAAIKVGTETEILRAADAYAAARGIFPKEANAGAENFVAQAFAAKWRLGLAVFAADQASVFLDKFKKPNDWASREFKERKDIEFELSAEAKLRRKGLAEAADEFQNTLEYAEAFDKGLVAKTSDPLAEDDRAAGALAPEAPCELKECRNKRIEHEIETTAEGSVAAYRDKKAVAAATPVPGMVKTIFIAMPGSKEASAPSAAGNEAAKKVDAPGAARAGPPVGLVSTKFFTRTLPGSTCFAIRKFQCKKVSCKGNPKLVRSNKCVNGEIVQCQVRPVPVRCD